MIKIPKRDVMAWGLGGGTRHNEDECEADSNVSTTSRRYETASCLPDQRLEQMPQTNCDLWR